jgi:hypothetical protein
MAIERHQEWTWIILGSLEKKFVILFLFFGGCRYMFKNWEEESVKIKGGNKQLENEHSSIFLWEEHDSWGSQTRFKQRFKSFPTIYNLELEISNVMGSNSTFGVLGFWNMFDFPMKLARTFSKPWLEIFVTLMVIPWAW